MAGPISKAIGFHANKCVLPISLFEQSRKEREMAIHSRKEKRKGLLSVEMCSQISQVFRTGQINLNLRYCDF